MSRSTCLLTSIAAAIALAAPALAQSAKSAPAPTAEEIVIKEKLRASGVSEINDLTRERDGTWRGRGRKGNAEVAVMVDTDGNVELH